MGSRGRKEQKEGGAGHAEHVAEIGAGGHKDVFQGVGKGRSAFLHALHENSQILFQKHDIRRFFGHIHRRVHGNADIGRMEGGGVIDAVPHVSHDMPRLAQGQDNAFFLVRLHFREDVRLRYLLQKSAVAYFPEFTARKNFCLRHAHILAHLGGHEAIVARNNFQRHTQLFEAVNRFGNVFFRRIEEKQKAEKGHILLLIFADDGCRSHLPISQTNQTQALSC